MPYDDPFAAGDTGIQDIIQRLKRYWGGTGLDPATMQTIQQRDLARQQTGAQAGRTLISPLTNYLQSRQAQPASNLTTQQMQAANEAAARGTIYDRQGAGTPTQTPTYAPPILPNYPTPPAPTAPAQRQQPQGQNEALASFLQQQEAAKQAKQAQMYQLINSMMGPQQEAQLTNRQKWGQAAVPMGMMLSQLGGALASPPYARSQVMANIGPSMANYAYMTGKQREDTENKKALREIRMLSALPHLMAGMDKGSEFKPHMVYDKDTKTWTVSPYPVSSVGQAERNPASFQAAAVQAYQSGDPATGDYYMQKAQEMATAGARYTHGIPQTFWDPEKDELIVAPSGTRQMTKGKQGLPPEITGKAPPQSQPPRPARPGMKWQWVPD